MALDGREYGQVAADMEFSNLPGKPRGNLQVELKQNGENLITSTGFLWEEPRLTLAPLVLKAPGSSIQGNIVVDVQKNLLTGDLNGKLNDLAALGRMLGESLKGSAQFETRFSAAKSGQDITISAKASALRTRLGGAKAVALSANLSNVWKAPQGDLSLDLKEMEGSGLILHELSLKGSAQQGKGELKLATRGHAVQDFDLQTRGTFSRSKDTDQLAINALGGHFGKYPLKLLQPVALKRAEAVWSLDRLALSLSDAHLEASGSLTPKQVRFESRIESFPLEILSRLGVPRFAGSAAGFIEMSGEPSSPSARMKLTLTNVGTEESARKGLPAALVNLEARLEGGQLISSVKVDGIVEKAVMTNISVPFKLSLLPFSCTLPPGGALSGHLEAAADLSRLTTLFPMADQQVSGHLDARLDLAGTVTHPEINGSAAIDRGSYQNLVYGTVLKDLSTNIALKGSRIEILDIRATDGEKGSLQAHGWVEVKDSKHFPLAVDAVFSDAKLIRRGDAVATVDGSAGISGSLHDMLLGGKLVVKSAEILIPKQLPNPITELHVIEINLPEKAGKPLDLTEAAPPLKIRLNLDVSSPGRIIIRGNNLSSEWKGHVHVAGSTEKPIITGNLSVVRGQYNFLDKPFNLTEGVVEFFGGLPPEPRLNITAEARNKDITARLKLTGTFSHPQLDLQSDPTLPSDEVLSRILFGRNLSNITHIQAVQLALALRSLSGEGNAFDLLERTRKLLGLENLGLTQETGGGTTLGLGRYLTEGVYVNVQKGLSNEPGKISIQVEVTPHVTLQTEAGTDASKGIELDWKYDY